MKREILLENGEEIKSQDKIYDFDLYDWKPIEQFMVGRPYNGAIYHPVKRETEIIFKRGHV